MVGVGDETGDGAEECKRFNLEMGRGGLNVRFVERDEGVIFLVHVEVFNEAFAEEVVEGDVALLKLLLGYGELVSICSQAKNQGRTIMWSEFTLGCPFSTMIIGRQMRPPSQAMWTARWWWLVYTLTNSFTLPALRTLRNWVTNRSGERQTPMMVPLT